MTKLRVSLVQLNTGNDIDGNLAALARALDLAHESGAELILTPENSTNLGANVADTLSKAQPEEAHPGLALARAFARERRVWLLLGSIHVKLPIERCANRSYLIDSQGKVVASYDKLHLFDAQVASGAYRESATFAPGVRAVLAATPWGKLGMTICYDVRFPYLYRALARAGATLFSVPSSFTVPTGQAHWHALLRARAIENGCFVFAPAQVGVHANNKPTYGHSLIVGPWGEVLADAGGKEPAVVTQEIDLAAVATAREAVPTLQHERDFDVECFG